jgi:hypothetical protein
MALSFGSVISFFYICSVNKEDGLRQARVYTPTRIVHNCGHHIKKPLSGIS